MNDKAEDLLAGRFYGAECPKCGEVSQMTGGAPAGSVGMCMYCGEPIAVECYEGLSVKVRPVTEGDIAAMKPPFRQALRIASDSIRKNGGIGSLPRHEVENNAVDEVARYVEEKKKRSQG